MWRRPPEYRGPDVGSAEGPRDARLAGSRSTGCLGPRRRAARAGGGTDVDDRHDRSADHHDVDDDIVDHDDDRDHDHHCNHDHHCDDRAADDRAAHHHVTHPAGTAD
jgi:hypothetical protein